MPQSGSTRRPGVRAGGRDDDAAAGADDATAHDGGAAATTPPGGSDDRATATTPPGGSDGATVDAVDAARVASVFRVLGDASRCRLVYALLRHDEISVGDLAAMLAMSESNVSHHLSVLRAHGLVRFRREGKQVFYAPDDEHIRLLLDLTLTHVRHGDADADAGANGGGAS